MILTSFSQFQNALWGRLSSNCNLGEPVTRGVHLKPAVTSWGVTGVKGLGSELCQATSCKECQTRSFG